MGMSKSLADNAMLEPIKPGKERGIVICWCCGSVFQSREEEVTWHHKIPHRYEHDPSYREIVRQFADRERDYEEGLLVPVCRPCHSKLNEIDQPFIDVTLKEWLTFWASERINFGKDLCAPKYRAIGQPLRYKPKKSGPRRLRK